MQPKTCLECLQAMSRGKSDLLARIACANCKQALEDIAEAHQNLHEMASKTVVGVRCSFCGKWFLTRNALSNHRRIHMLPVG
jgi:hypothetical protein